MTRRPAPRRRHSVRTRLRHHQESCSIAVEDQQSCAVPLLRTGHYRGILSRNDLDAAGLLSVCILSNDPPHELATGAGQLRDEGCDQRSTCRCRADRRSRPTNLAGRAFRPTTAADWPDGNRYSIAPGRMKRVAKGLDSAHAVSPDDDRFNGDRRNTAERERVLERELATPPQKEPQPHAPADRQNRPGVAQRAVGQVACASGASAAGRHPRHRWAGGARSSARPCPLRLCPRCTTGPRLRPPGYRPDRPRRSDTRRSARRRRENERFEPARQMLSSGSAALIEDAHCSCADSCAGFDGGRRRAARLAGNARPTSTRCVASPG